MRILLATSHRSIVGGVETHLRLLIPALIERGHKIALLYQYRTSAESEMIDPPGTEIPAWCWQDLEHNPLGWADIAAWNPDLVYSHCPDSPELEALLLANYPCIIHLHNYWGTCISGRKCHDVPTRRPCDRQFGPMCLAMYFPRRCGGLSPVTAFKMFQIQKDRRSRLRDYKKILVSSEHMRREYERHGVGPEQLQMVSYPVTDTDLELEPYAPLPLGGSLVFVGRLTDLKGVDLAMRAIPEAAQRLGRSLTLTVIGDGAELTRLQGLAQELGVQAQFPGWLTSTEKMALLRQANLLVVPSWWPEPFGLAGAEAARLSVPAVGYAVGGVPEWLVPGRSGELAPGDPPTVSGLAGAMVKALSDPSHYARLRRGAWEVSGQFSMNAHLSQLEEIIEQVQIDASSSAAPSVQVLDLESSEFAEKGR